MNEAKREEIQKWVIKSEHDLGSAYRLMEGDEPYLDTAVFHCQQAVEKAMKAFLTYHDILFEKTGMFQKTVDTSRTECVRREA